MVLAQIQSQNQLQSRSDSHVITNSPSPHWDWDYVPYDICHLSGHITMAICVFPCTHVGSSMYPTYRSFGTELWFSFQLSILVCLWTAASLPRMGNNSKPTYKNYCLVFFYFIQYLGWPREVLHTAKPITWVLSKQHNFKLIQALKY